MINYKKIKHEWLIYLVMLALFIAMAFAAREKVRERMEQGQYERD